MMDNGLKEIYNEMQKLVDSGDVYLFESIDDKGDEDYFEPFKGKPTYVGSEMFVTVEEGNGVLRKGAEVMIDPNEYCFMDITKVEG